MHIDLAGAVSVQLVESRLQLLVGVATLLTLTHHCTELVKVELVVVVDVLRRKVLRVATHADTEVILAVAGHVISIWHYSPPSAAANCTCCWRLATACLETR